MLVGLVTGETCKRCGDAHSLMELCPHAPSFIDCLRGWLEGERGPMNYLAMLGSTLLVTLTTLIVIAVLRG